MFRLMHRFFKWTVVGGLLLVGLVSVVGLTRVKTAWWSVRDHLRSNVDELVDTRVALQHEIRKLQKEYPERIADLRLEQREIEKDLEACARDIGISEEVVALCESDAEVLRTKIATAEGRGPTHALVEFRAERLETGNALERAGHIAETAESYRERLADLTAERGMLLQERARVAAEVAELESEYREFQAEVGSLLREIDSLKRKEKLVDLSERRERDHEDMFSDRASALAAVKDRIERRKIELDERLRAFRTFRPGNEYEARARLRLMSPEGE